MDVLKVIELLRRQRAAACIALVVAIALVGTAYASAPPRFRASASLVLLAPPSPPESVTVGADGASLEPVRDEYLNPYARFDDLSIVVDIVARRMRSPAVADRLLERGAEDVSIAGNVDFNNGPIIDIAAEATSRSGAVDGAAVAMDEVGRQLRQLQAEQGTDEHYYIDTATVVRPERATAVISGTIRRVLVAGVLGVGFVVASAMLVDALVSRPRRARHRVMAVEPVRGARLQFEPRHAGEDPLAERAAP